MLNKEESIFKNDDIFFIRILTLGCSSLVTILYCLFVELFYKNVLDVESIRRLFVFETSEFVAEGSEKLQYMGSAVLFTLCVLFFNYIFKKAHINFSKLKWLQYLVSALILVVPVCAAFAFCIKNLPEFSSAPKNIVAIIGAALLIAFGIAVGKLGKNNKKAASVLLYAQTIGFSLIIVAFNLFKKVGCEDGFNWHFDALYFPVEKLLDGLTEGVDYRILSLPLLYTDENPWYFFKRSHLKLFNFMQRPVRRFIFYFVQYFEASFKKYYRAFAEHFGSHGTHGNNELLGQPLSILPVPAPQSYFPMHNAFNDFSFLYRKNRQKSFLFSRNCYFGNVSFLEYRQRNCMHGWISPDLLVQGSL